MEFTDEARRMIEERLKVVMAGMTLSEKDKTEVENELRSGMFSRAEAKASAKGSQAVSAEDVSEVLAEERAPADIAASYTRSYGAGLPRAGFWVRLVAYIIDSVVIGLAIGIAIMPVFIVGLLAGLFDNSPALTALALILALAAGLLSFGIVICYFIVLEGRYGKTVGKYLLGLTVLRTNGERIGYKEALLRNIPKYIRNFLILDALIMVIFFNKEKQRAFDKVADTMVVYLR